MLRSKTAMASEESYPKLISLAVHEFRTPASVVGGYLRMLQRDTETPLGDRQRKMIDEAEKSCARLVALIAELSEVGKIDDGHIAGDQATDLFPLVAEVAGSVHEADERDVRLEVRGRRAGAPMAGDVGPASRRVWRHFSSDSARKSAAPCRSIARAPSHEDGSRSSAVIVVAERRERTDAHTTRRRDRSTKNAAGSASRCRSRVASSRRTAARIWSPCPRR